MADFKIFDSLDGFIKSVPRTVPENLQFRINLHTMLAKDPKMQEIFWAMCRENKQILFDTTFWTLNPQKPWGEQNQPFILRPKQIEAVAVLDDCIINGKDVGINKTRKQGATEIVTKLFAAWCILYDKVHFIVGSDKKEDVDQLGNDYTLMAKIDNAFEYLPSWMGFAYNRYSPNVKIQRKDMLIRIMEKESTIVGDTTNENFSASKRATAIMLDEFGRIRKSVAESIEGTVHDVSNCVIYTSTHWLGANHPFNLALQKETTERIDLMWYDNPEENVGLYSSPQSGVIKLWDTNYYQEKYPELLKYAAG